MARNNDDGRDRLWTGEFSTFWTEPWETGSRRLAVHYVDCGVGCQAHIIRCPMMSSPSTPAPFHQAASSWRWRRPMAGQLCRLGDHTHASSSSAGCQAARSFNQRTRATEHRD